MDELSQYDALTALPGPARFHEALRRAACRAGSADRRFSVLAIGVDWSGSARVKLAHGALERLLMEVARRLRGATRKSDMVARLADVRFGILLLDADSASAAAAAGHVSAVLSAPVSEGDCRLMLNTAIGTASFPDDGRSPAELLRHAEEAVRRAQDEAGGPGAWPRPHLRLTRRLHLGARLRDSLASGSGLSPLWQPLVRTADRAVVGAKAGLLWDQADLGPVACDALAEVAEQSGLVTELDRRLLEQAAQSGAPWLNAGGAAERRITVNLSAERLRRPETTDEILSLLRRHRLRPDQLELDLAERLLPDLGAVAWHVIRTLATAGVSFAVDDVGSANSNLGNLARLAPNRLKLGPAFTRNVTSSGIDRAVVATLTFFGRNLGMKVVAEAVESEAQLELLHDLGCEEAQGPLFGPPGRLPAPGAA